MADLVELTCPGCGRVLKQGEDVLVRRVKEGKPLRCLFCARDLPLPEALAARLGPPSPREPTKRLGKCPCCLRPAQASGPAELVQGWCPACAVAFRCDAPGHGSFDLPAPQVAALAEVQSAAERFGKLPLGGAIALALRTRLERGSLAAGEPARLAHMAEGLAHWRKAPDEPLVPWVAEEVGPLLAPFFFGAPYATRNASTGLYHLQLSMMLDAPGGGMSPGTKLALNAVGVGLLVATGTGFTVSGGEPQPAEQLTKDYWVGLTDTPRGCALDVATAQNHEAPRRLDVPERLALAKRLFGLKPALERYVRALALCGPAVRGAGAKQLTREAARVRLVDVGVPAHEATRAADSFVVGPLQP